VPMLGFIKIIGESQGAIEGSCDMPEGTIEVFAFVHKVKIPRSHDTGLPRGRRAHDDLTISKEVDKSTPKLYKALCEGERLTEVELSWYRPSGMSGNKEQYYIIRLENAIITGIEPCSPQRLDMSKEGYQLMEDVSFAYERIIWTWKPDGIEHEDSWIAPADN